MLHWPHSLYKRLKEAGMCAAACSMWWLGWILYKTTQREGSYQSGGTWSTGAALVSALTKGEKKPQPCDIQTKTSTEQCTDGGHGCSFHFFSLFPLQHFLLEGQPSLAKLKANSVVWTWGRRVNTGCCDVCGEWVTMCGGHSWYWACGAISFLAGWDVLRSLVPHPGLTCWAMTTNQMTSIAALSDLWPLGFELPCREGLFEKPSWFNNIFSPGAAKALSCLTPVAPSVELQHNCSCLP